MKKTKKMKKIRKKTMKCKKIGSTQFEVYMIKKRIEQVKANNLKNSIKNNK